jgi:integrase
MDAEVDGKALRRDRVLTPDELRRVWEAAGEMGTYGMLVRVLMLTGQRVNDWAKAEHDEIADLLLTVPARRFKTNTAHAVPLTPRVVELLSTLDRFQGCAFVFSIDGYRPFGNFSKEKRRLDKASRVMGWKLNDLRRTVRTNLPRLGVVRHVAKAVIGHVVASGVDAHYDLYEYLDEKRDALLKWEAELLRIVERDNSSTESIATELVEREVA